MERTGTGRSVDAIISPAVAYTAVPHGLNTYVHLKCGGALLTPRLTEFHPETHFIQHCAMPWITPHLSSP